MNASATARRLSEAIRQATRSAKVCVAGGLPVVDPGIAVDGLGTNKLPRCKKTSMGSSCWELRSAFPPSAPLSSACQNEPWHAATP